MLHGGNRGLSGAWHLSKQSRAALWWCLAPMEAGTFASHCVRFIRCLAPIEAVERRALLATRGPPGAVPGTDLGPCLPASGLAPRRVPGTDLGPCLLASGLGSPPGAWYRLGPPSKPALQFTPLPECQENLRFFRQTARGLSPASCHLSGFWFWPRKPNETKTGR